MKLLLAAAIAVWCIAVAPASAFTAATGRAAADRAAIAWAQGHQQPDGAFVDYVSRRPTYGYATMMLGYGLLRAGARRHDEQVVRSGFRAIRSVIVSTHAQRGVFDALVNATTYEWALRNLPRDPSFVALRTRWETYLRSISKPYIKSTNLQACTADPVCFHNHEAVGAFGDLQLLSTGLHSTVPGAKLADPAALRASSLRVLSAEIPVAIGHGASFAFGSFHQSGLGLLSDTGTWPLAYHAFSTAMVAGAAHDLGAALPAPARASLLGAAGALMGLMAPDGDVAYLGRRQQQAWALASAIYAATITERVPGVSAREAASLRTVADRAFARLLSANRFGPGGIGAVPRPLTPRSGYHGVDANEVVPAALTIFLLNLAADEERGGPHGSLPADTDGAFVEPDRTGFVAVRHGDLWYAIHRQTITYDLRYDFGLVALKRRDAAGRWIDIVRPRPNSRGPKHNSAGPVLVVAGVRYMPYGRTISVSRGGVVVMRGGFRAQHGQWLRRGVTFRFTPVAGGVAMSFPLRAGDHASIASYLPASEARHRGSVVFDSHMTASVSGLQPSSVHAIDRGYASCCDDHLVAATAELRPRVNATVTYTVRARAAAGSAPAGGGGELLRTSHRRHHRRGGGGISAAAVAVAALGVLGALWIGAAAARRRRRRARRRVRR